MLEKWIKEKRQIVFWSVVTPKASVLRRKLLEWSVWLGVPALLLIISSMPINTRAQTLEPITVAQLTEQLGQPVAKPTLLCFWATWCKPCLDEIPLLLQAAGQAPDSLQVIFVSVDFPSKRSAVLQTVRKLHMPKTYHLIDASGDWVDRIDPQWSGAIPFSILLVNSRRHYKYDAFTGVSEILEFIQSHKTIQP